MENHKKLYYNAIDALKNYGKVSEGSIEDFLADIINFVRVLSEKNQELRDLSTRDLNRALKLQDKLHRRNTQIKELKKKLAEYQDQADEQYREDRRQGRLDI